MKKAEARRVTFDPIHQMYLEIRESTANVNYVTVAVMKKWGKGYLLVTADGLPLEDTDGTRGKSGNVYSVLYNIVYRSCVLAVSKEEALRCKAEKTRLRCY